MTALDLYLMAAGVVVVCFVAWVAFNVGRDTGERSGQASIATLRARLRRAEKDRDDALDENTVLRGRRG